MFEVGLYSTKRCIHGWVSKSVCDQTEVDEAWVRVTGIIRTNVTWWANSVHHGLKFIQNQPEVEEKNKGVVGLGI